MLLQTFFVFVFSAVYVKIAGSVTTAEGGIAHFSELPISSDRPLSCSFFTPPFHIVQTLIGLQLYPNIYHECTCSR